MLHRIPKEVVAPPSYIWFGAGFETCDICLRSESTGHHSCAKQKFNTTAPVYICECQDCGYLVQGHYFKPRRDYQGIADVICPRCRNQDHPIPGDKY